jgi:hypothetical protein
MCMLSGEGTPPRPCPGGSYSSRGRANGCAAYVSSRDFVLTAATPSSYVDVVNADRLPTWNRGDEFRPAREKCGVK